MVRKPKEKNERQRRHARKALGNQLGPVRAEILQVLMEMFQFSETLGNQVAESQAPEQETGSWP